MNLVGCPSRVALRTDAVREAGGFDERLSIVADWDLGCASSPSTRSCAAPSSLSAT